MEIKFKGMKKEENLKSAYLAFRNRNLFFRFLK